MKVNSAKKLQLNEKSTVINVRERIRELKEEKIRLLTSSLTVEGVAAPFHTLEQNCESINDYTNGESPSTSTISTDGETLLDRVLSATNNLLDTSVSKISAQYKTPIKNNNKSPHQSLLNSSAKKVENSSANKSAKKTIPGTNEEKKLPIKSKPSPSTTTTTTTTTNTEPNRSSSSYKLGATSKQLDSNNNNMISPKSSFGSSDGLKSPPSERKQSIITTTTTLSASKPLNNTSNVSVVIIEKLQKEIVSLEMKLKDSEDTALYLQEKNSFFSEEIKNMSLRVRECESQTLTSQELNRNLLRKIEQLTSSLANLKKIDSPKLLLLKNKEKIDEIMLRMQNNNNKVMGREEDLSTIYSEICDEFKLLLDRTCDDLVSVDEERVYLVDHFPSVSFEPKEESATQSISAANSYQTKKRLSRKEASQFDFGAPSQRFPVTSSSSTIEEEGEEEEEEEEYNNNNNNNKNNNSNKNNNNNNSNKEDDNNNSSIVNNSNNEEEEQLYEQEEDENINVSQ